MSTKRIIILLLLINFKMASSAIAIQLLNKNHPSKELNEFYNFLGKQIKLSPLNQDKLPPPYDFLLTQPLMTIGLEKYYSCTPQIQKIEAVKNEQENTYSRIIAMLVDSNKKRNDVNIARARKEEVVVELALITMNFNELPKEIITSVLNTNIPFGELLIENNLEVVSERHYFSVDCDAILFSDFHCSGNKKIYGRINTLIRKDNDRWVARVVEILPDVTL